MENSGSCWNLSRAGLLGFLPFEVNVKCAFSVEFLAFCLSLDPSPDGFLMLSELQLHTLPFKIGVTL